KKTGVSMESGLANAKPKGEEKANTVRAVEMYTRSMNSTSTNDLASLKKYFDANGGGINSYVKAIEYSYAAEPQIYALGTDKPVQVHPEQAFSQYSGGFSLSPASAMFSMDAFRQLPENTALYTSKYRVLDGRWPTNAHELVLVLDENGEMPDLYEYTLGLKDHAKLDEMMENTQAGRASGDSDSTSGDKNSTKPSEYTYDQIIGTEFSRVNAFETYTHNDDTGTWIDRSGDADFMREKIEKGERLTIVGIVRPNEGEDMGALQQGISYLPALTDQVITEAAQSEIVHEQRAHPDVDVFTGKTFDELKNDDQGDDFDMSSLFTVDQEKIRGAFQIDESKLQMDLSGLDLSSMPAPNFDPGALDMSDLDLSSLDPGAAAVGPPTVEPQDLDLAGLTARYPQLADIDLQGALTKALEGDVIRPGAGAYLSGEAGALIQGFQEYYAAHADSDGDQIPDRDTAEVVLEYMQTDEVKGKLDEISNSDKVVDRALLEQQLFEALGDDPALKDVSAAVSNDLSSAIAEQLSTQLGGALASQIQQAIGEYLTNAIGSMMQEYMSALQGEIERQINDAMSTMGENFANAMSVDPEKFADAFEMNMDKEELAAFMSTMVSTRAASYEDNLEKLGWADRTSPDQVNIYPASFKDKDKVKAILDSYNAQAKARGEKKKEIVYTDMVGMLMSSVTSIINVITWMLIAFVSISLVVSSIMIAIITYISVLERRKEIGILRAVGASKADVRHVFNAETVIEGLLAGLIGVGITLLLCIPANIIVEQKFDVENIASLPPLAGVILVGISVLLTVLAGVIPSGRAARQDPVEALRAE
ncbi:MAG: ABC transporter permease, partial [Dermabacter sp.]|nr:ABC transporter permease [Dermabacter sp.]